MRDHVEALTREWAIENLLFYRSVMHYANSLNVDAGMTPREHARLARAIFEEFIERVASSQVSATLQCLVLYATGLCGLV